MPSKIWGDRRVLKSSPLPLCPSMPLVIRRLRAGRVHRMAGKDHPPHKTPHTVALRLDTFYAQRREQ